MKIYDEKTGEEIAIPDLVNGKIYNVQRNKGTEKWVVPGTVTEDNPDGMILDVPVFESCFMYHAYTEEEKQKVDNDARITSLENELAATKILLGVE